MDAGATENLYLCIALPSHAQMKVRGQEQQSSLFETFFFIPLVESHFVQPFLSFFAVLPVENHYRFYKFCPSFEEVIWIELDIDSLEFGYAFRFISGIRMFWQDNVQRVTASVGWLMWQRDDMTYPSVWNQGGPWRVSQGLLSSQFVNHSMFQCIAVHRENRL